MRAGIRLRASCAPRSELDDVYQSACAVGALVSPAESASI